MNAPPAEVRERLLTAWRGEILAGSVYLLIARRLQTREADILRRMADAESGHRGRLEQRMGELGVPVPDPSSVRVPLWLRLQSRIAPVDRLLAAREAAEDEEVDDLYRRDTGDPVTDQLLRDIRREERTHSRAVAEIRSGGDGAEAALSETLAMAPAAPGLPQPPQLRQPPQPPQPPHLQSQPPGDTGDGPPVAIPGSKARLDRILAREKWHRTGGSWISGAIYGANDGLAAVFGIVAGVSAATGGSSSVLTAGLAAAIASALSMATGAFLAERSEAEVAAANIERERQEIVAHPEEEKEELSLFYQLKGIDAETADVIAGHMSRHPDAMLQALAAEEFGISVNTGSDPTQAALAAGISTGLGAIVPVIPFMITTGTVAIVAAAIVSLIAHFLVGAAKSLVTLRTWWSAGLEMTMAGVIVGGATYLVGLALPT